VVYDYWVESAERSDFGERVPGIAISVFDERAVRASAGLLFLFGTAGWSTAFFTGNPAVLRAFGAMFMIEMVIRLTVSHRFAPFMALGSLAVRWQRPEWVSASQKRFAWTLGLIMSGLGCFGFGWLGFPIEWMLVLCGVCLFLLFMEAALGICVGCELQRAFSKKPPQLCPGDRCSYTPSQRLLPREESSA
jgi:hypothetical protein